MTAPNLKESLNRSSGAGIHTSAEVVASTHFARRLRAWVGDLMEFRLLGPVEVWNDGCPVDVGHAKQRSVLAVLSMEAGNVVSAAKLIDWVWGNEPPDGALNVLYAYIARLRKALAPWAAQPVRRSGGYLLDVDPETVDVHRFRRLLAEAQAAQTAAGDAGEAGRIAATLDDALALWRGTPFAGFTSRWLVEARAVLLDERLSALVERNEAYLRDGRHAELVGPLRQLIGEHPVDERPVAQLMLALYRSGRASEALDEYRLAHRRLAEARGTDLGTALRQLQQRILRDDPTLASWASSARPMASALPVPAGLPHDVPAFVGRRTELARLDALVPAGNTHRSVVISVVDGTAGVGKTALALHWAHRVKRRFPDGNLYADLHGYGPGLPADPGRVLDGFLAVLDVAPPKIPVDLDAKAALYRSLLDERRMLVVLDNAATPQQIRPLLPGSPGCLVIVTSRSSLTGLVARNGAQRINLDVLPADDAVALLGTFLGSDRVAAHPQAAHRLALLCAYLPVALCTAGARAAEYPDRTLEDLAEELAVQHQRLDLLDVGDDPGTAVRAVFSWSYGALPPSVARTFRLLGLHPGHDVDAYAAAALIDTDIDEATRLLDALVHAHLVTQYHPGRYRMHDLLRVYAAERAAIDDTEADRRLALTRLFDHYLATADVAAQILAPAQGRGAPGVAPPATPSPPLTDLPSALAWLDAERVTLVTVTGYAAEHGWPDQATRMTATLAPYFLAGHLSDALTIHTHARDAARHANDPAAEAEALSNLGTVHYRQGCFPQAADHHRQALALFRETSDASGEAHALSSLSAVYVCHGHYQQAVDHLEDAVVLFRETGDRFGEAHALETTGFAYERQGRYERAADHHQQALALYRAVGNAGGEAAALIGLGIVHGRQGRYEQAADQLQQALALFRKIGNPGGEGVALSSLGTVHQQQGHYDRAVDHHRRALVLAREVGYPAGEVDALNGLGEALQAAGRPGQARPEHEAALALASRIGFRFEQARAHDGLAHIYLSTGDSGQARRHWRQALDIYTSLAVPNAAGVADHLASLDHRSRIASD